MIIYVKATLRHALTGQYVAKSRSCVRAIGVGDVMHKKIHFGLIRKRIIIAIFIILLFFIILPSAAAQCNTYCVFVGTKTDQKCSLVDTQYPGWTDWVCLAPCNNTCMSMNFNCTPICLPNSSAPIESFDFKFRAEIYGKKKYDVYLCQDFKWCDNTQKCEEDGKPYEDNEEVGYIYCYDKWISNQSPNPIIKVWPNSCCCR